LACTINAQAARTPTDVQRRTGAGQVLLVLHAIGLTATLFAGISVYWHEMNGTLRGASKPKACAMSTGRSEGILRRGG